MAVNIKFIHCADLHLDSPFQGMVVKEPSLADKFKNSTNEAFKKIIDICLAEKADFLTIGGDTFDGADRSLKAQILLRDQFERLNNAGIPVAIVAGNHDPLSDWMYEEIKFPKNVHLFSGNQLESIPIIKSGNTITTIYGISYREREVKENLSLKYHAENKNSFSIGMLHANVGSRGEHAPYSPCTASDLKSSNMDIWLLGHIHTPETVCEDPLILYPGNIQGRHIGESGPRGCYLINVNPAHRISYEFKPVQNIIWKHDRLNIERIDTLSDLLDLLSEKCEEELSNLTNGEKGIVVRWELKGATPLYNQLMQSDRLKELEEEIVERFFKQEPFIFPESFKLSIKPVLNKEDFIGQENFIGDFLRLAEKANHDGQMNAELLKMLNQPFANRTVRKYVNEIGEPELKNILKDAVNLGMDLLSTEK